MDVREIMLEAINGGIKSGLLKTKFGVFDNIHAPYQLSELSGVEVETCKALINGIKECKIRDLEDVLDSLGYQLTSVGSKDA